MPLPAPRLAPVTMATCGRCSLMLVLQVVGAGRGLREIENRRTFAAAMHRKRSAANVSGQARGQVHTGIGDVRGLAHASRRQTRTNTREPSRSAVMRLR